MHPLGFSAGERGLLLLERDKGATLLCDNLTVESSANEPHVDRKVVETWYDHRHSAGNRDHALMKALKQVAGSLAGRPGLVEGEWLPLCASEVLPLADVKNVPVQGRLSLGTEIRGLRRQKEADEIVLLKQCMRAADAGHARAWEILRTGISEMDVYREVQMAALATAATAGADLWRLPGDHDRNARFGRPSDELPSAVGRLFILDFSVVLNGYRSDFTNTLAVGLPTMKQQETFQICEEALRSGESVLQAGTTSGRRLRRRLAGLYGSGPATVAAPRGPRHRPGPSRAADLRSRKRRRARWPATSSRSNRASYEKGVGGMRFEHNYLITETGAERLSNHRISLT